jgi:general secretion pathway protein N
VTTLPIKTRYLALFAAGYFILTLIVTAPAYLLDTAIGYFSHQRLSLANCQGTIWHGSATPLLHMGSHTSLVLHTLQWRVNPQALLLGRLSVALAWDNLDTRAPMQLLADSKSVVLSNMLLPLPAEIIGELSPYLKPAQFSGSLMIESPQLIYSEDALQGNATARWLTAGSAMSSVNPLGNYQIDIKATQDKLSTTLTTQNGALLLGGQGIWSRPQGFHFYGTARATNQRALNELLHHLGPESSPGTYQISI